jgi:hypothetical protein
MKRNRWTTVSQEAVPRLRSSRNLKGQDRGYYSLGSLMPDITKPKPIVNPYSNAGCLERATGTAAFVSPAVQHLEVH